MIHLKKEDYFRILHHACSCLPEEAYGLLAGHCEGDSA